MDIRCDSYNPVIPVPSNKNWRSAKNFDNDIYNWFIIGLYCLNPIIPVTSYDIVIIYFVIRSILGKSVVCRNIVGA